MKNNNAAATHTWKQKTPVGTLIISAGPTGVTSVLLNGSMKAAGRDAPASATPPAQRAIARAFDRYFAGDAHALDGLQVDLSGVQSDFHRRVLTTLRALAGPGTTLSYGELAAVVGHPGAARAVGSVMARNPVPIILPCHRVLASDGTLGGYGGGLEMKRSLLRIEGVDLAAPKRRS
ncbi:MAG: methylated-DNA--[protein]-cysteine S-methyltransferase [Dehalococcoidia bacterium]